MGMGTHRPLGASLAAAIGRDDISPSPRPGRQSSKGETTHVEEQPGASSSSAPAPAAPVLDPELRPITGFSERYTVEVLHTSKGLLRGSWGQFRASAFYRSLPASCQKADGSAEDDRDDVRTLRHLLIKALNITKYAEREGEAIEIDELGEGSYSMVYGAQGVAAKVISDRERPWVHKAAVENAFEADRLDLGPRIFGHGSVEQGIGGNFKGTVIFMERLDPLGDLAFSEADIRALLSNVQRISQHGFHNDLKLQNVLRRAGRPVVIDFDLMARWSVKVAVTANCIERDFQELLEPLGETAWSFREYYDLFSLSLTLPDGPFYRTVLRRLLELWAILETPVLGELLASVGPEKMREIPYEVLIRVPLHGVTVNLLDLRGNLFVHQGAQAAKHLGECSDLPQLLRSNGVYWPDPDEGES